ncbi:unnamed protein product, partial [marine sediment metagenome]
MRDKAEIFRDVYEYWKKYRGKDPNALPRMLDILKATIRYLTGHDVDVDVKVKKNKVLV